MKRWYMTEKTPGEKCNLVFPKTIERWDEAIPLGNGICGALIWGSANALRFSLDRGDIWDSTPFEGIYEKEFSYPHMVKLAREGNIDEIRRIFSAPYDLALPSKLPVGKLIFHFSCDENVYSTLNLERAEACVEIGGHIRIESILHARQQVGLIKIEVSDTEFSYEIENPPYSVAGQQTPGHIVADSLNTASLEQLYYPAPELVSDKNKKSFIQEISPEFSYGIFVMEKRKDGFVEIAYTVATSCDGAEWKKRTWEILKGALEQGYDAMLQSHMSWWKEYWAKSSITLPDSLFEKNWYLTQYLLASCSRKGAYPMPLQGVWTADDGKLPPWKGDYHLDLNVQMSYYSYLKANHLEEGEALIDYLWKMADCGRQFARSFYHSKGLCLPSAMALTGEPLGGWAMYAFSPTNQLWICQLMERHYRATGEKHFLEKKAYPYLKETAEFILGLLEERDGEYYLPISSAPEVHDDNIEAFVTPNSNYDLALMRYLFGILSDLAQELQNGEENEWKEVLRHLPQLAVNEKGSLKLSPDEELQESHRHFSHVMAIHPLRLLPYEGEENCRTIDATIFDLERLGTGYWVGFSFTWMAELYAIQRNGNGAAYQLEIFWKNHCSPNGFHLNGDYKKRGTSTFHYRPFTLEANFCAADALQEMLLQSEDNMLQLFPAVPDEWKDETVAFVHFRAERGLLVSASMEQGIIVSIVLEPEYSVDICLRRNAGLHPLAEHMQWNGEENNEWIKLSLKKGRKYIYELIKSN